MVVKHLRHAVPTALTPTILLRVLPMHQGEGDLVDRAGVIPKAPVEVTASKIQNSAEALSRGQMERMFQ